MYYQLHDHCILVTGALRGAIYDLRAGQVHSVNRGAVELLTFCQQSTVESLLDDAASAGQVPLDFLDKLTAMDLGACYFNQPKARGCEQPVPEAPKLNFLWLELTSYCNNRCLHCYATSGPTKHEDVVPHERWLSLISEGRQAGATAIQFIGGEPLVYPRWRELVIKAHEEGYDFIEIFTNATLIDDSCIEFFKQYKVNMATTIYADNAEVHDKVTLNPGSFDKTLAAVRKCLAAQIPLRIASIIMKVNENEADNIMKLCGELGVEVTPPDVVRPTGRGDDSTLLPENYAKPPIKPPFFTDPQSFEKAQHCHSCLAGKIAITASGDVIPCIFARNQSCGNILQQPLADILTGHLLQQCWHTTKDDIEKCKDCEFRYACMDCRPLAQGHDPDKKWLACSAGCSYNPYTGTWED